MAPDAAELRRFLRALVPAYMVPSRYVPLRTLPTTPNGKVDRNALPEPSPAAAGTRRVEPGNEKERQLAELWGEVLGVSPVAPHDDFFDLGGHSLLVPKLLRRVEEAFGRRLSPAALYHAPTVDAMAALLVEPEAAGLPRIIELQPRGSRPPLFWLGAEPTFRGLADAVGLDQPFLGVDLRLDELGTGRPRRLDEIARDLVRVVRSAQPAGPYYLGGHCTDGILAYEVASQLVREGHQVGLLVLLHSTNPTVWRSACAVAYQAGKLRFHLGESLRRRGRERWSYSSHHIGGILQRALSRTRGDLLGERLPAIDVLERAARAYEPAPYPGDVVLLQPAERPAILDYRSGWAEVVAGRLTACDVPGTHWTMLRQPLVRDLGAILGACLARAQEGVRARTLATV